MAIPLDMTRLRNRLSRFLSKDETEITSPFSPQNVANIEATGDYTGGGLGTTGFAIQPPPGFVYSLSRVLIRISGNQTLSSDEYTNGGPLNTGVMVKITSNVNPDILVTPFPIKEIADYASYAGNDVMPLENPSKSWVVRWSFFRSGAPVWLIGDKEERAVLELSDDFSSLTHHTALMQGMLYEQDQFARP